MATQGLTAAVAARGGWITSKDHREAEPRMAGPQRTQWNSYLAYRWADVPSCLTREKSENTLLPWGWGRARALLELTELKLYCSSQLMELKLYRSSQLTELTLYLSS